MTPRNIFLDIDGTLVDYSGNLPESARNALMKAHSLGHRLFVCTGRFYSQIYGWLIRDIPFDGFITSSGARVRYHGETIFTRFMGRDMILTLKRVLSPLGVPIMFHTDSCLVTTENELEEARRFFERNGLRRDACDALFGNVAFGAAEDLPDIEKAVYYGAKPFSEMKKLFDGFALDPYSYKHLPSTCGEVTMSGVSKAVGIGALLDHLGEKPEDAIAVGDGGNDIEMIRFVGTGVAMGNACDALKREASLVTSPISENGIYAAFEKLGLVDELS